MTAARKSWRDHVAVHPAADVFPMMADAELKDLAEDIAANGLRVEPVFWTDEASGAEYLIDGRNRLAALELNGFDFSGKLVFELAEARIGTETPRENKGGGFVVSRHDLLDPVAQVIALNIHRRHLTKTEKARLIVKAMEAATIDVPEIGKSIKNDVATSARSFNPTPGKKGGSTKSVRGKAVEEAAKHGISRSTVDQAIAEDAAAFGKGISGGRSESTPDRPARKAKRLTPAEVHERGVARARREVDRLAGKFTAEELIEAVRGWLRDHDDRGPGADEIVEFAKAFVAEHGWDAFDGAYWQLRDMYPDRTTLKV